MNRPRKPPTPAPKPAKPEPEPRRRQELGEGTDDAGDDPAASKWGMVARQRTGQDHGS